VQRKYPIDYLYRLFPSVKDSLYAILMGLFVTISLPEFHTIPYSYFLLSGYIVWVSVSGAFYTIVTEFVADQLRKNVLTLYVYGTSFIELALGYAIMQTLNAILFSIPFMIALGVLGVSFAIDIVSLISIVVLYALSWAFFFALALIILGLNVLYKHTAMLQRAAFDIIALLSGLSFSVQVIPDPIRSIVYLLPTYYLLTTTRYALLNRYLPYNIPLYLAASGIITVLTSIVGYLFLKKSVRIAKKKGILWTY
jgi:ABC-type polysaccharide/polyol phosphate export permease